MGLVSNDFSVLYVAANSNSALPLPIAWPPCGAGTRIDVAVDDDAGAVVAGRVVVQPTAAVARGGARTGRDGGHQHGLLLFLLLVSSPFLRLLPPAMEGRDLNPLLQDAGMVSHPPMLYMGYVGFAVAFSFAMAALLSGRLDATWARWSRPWTTAAWACLTTGIMLGSAWAYYELGWGGWWFWDPVENASFMPWLAGTALIHSLAVTEKRGVFRAWTALLAIFTFSLGLLGTFLVRFRAC
ncbi:cytochrome c biogenesis protein CcsA [Cupriavidus basilensis]